MPLYIAKSNLTGGMLIGSFDQNGDFKEMMGSTYISKSMFDRWKFIRIDCNGDKLQKQWATAEEAQK